MFPYHCRGDWCKLSSSFNFARSATDAVGTFQGTSGMLLKSPCTNDFILRGYLAPYDYVEIGKYSNEQMTVNLLKGRGSDGDYAIKEMLQL